VDAPVEDVWTSGCPDVDSAPPERGVLVDDLWSSGRRPVDNLAPVVLGRPEVAARANLVAAG
jgi:hypothetical protein